MESPEAMAPRIVDTRTRVPRITGLPWQTDGFISRRLFTVEQYDVPHGHQVPMSTLSTCHLPQPGQRIPPGLTPQANRTNHPASCRDAASNPSNPSNLPHLHKAAIPKTLTLPPQMLLTPCAAPAPPRNGWSTFPCQDRDRRRDSASFRLHSYEKRKNGSTRRSLCR